MKRNLLEWAIARLLNKIGDVKVRLLHIPDQRSGNARLQVGTPLTRHFAYSKKRLPLLKSLPLPKPKLHPALVASLLVGALVGFIIGIKFYSELNRDSSDSSGAMGLNVSTIVNVSGTTISNTFSPVVSAMADNVNNDEDRISSTSDSTNDNMNDNFPSVNVNDAGDAQAADDNPDFLVDNSNQDEATGTLRSPNEDVAESIGNAHAPSDNLELSDSFQQVPVEKLNSEPAAYNVVSVQPVMEKEEIEIAGEKINQIETDDTVDPAAELAAVLEENYFVPKDVLVTTNYGTAEGYLEQSEEESDAKTESLPQEEDLSKIVVDASDLVTAAKLT